MHSLTFAECDPIALGKPTTASSGPGQRPAAILALRPSGLAPVDLGRQHLTSQNPDSQAQHCRRTDGSVALASSHNGFLQRPDRRTGWLGGLAAGLGGRWFAGSATTAGVAEEWHGRLEKKRCDGSGRFRVPRRRFVATFWCCAHFFSGFGRAVGVEERPQVRSVLLHRRAEDGSRRGGGMQLQPGRVKLWDDEEGKRRPRLDNR